MADQNPKGPELDPYDQLMLLKNMTVSFGVIHEAQGHQLKHYPILIPGITKGSANIDPEKKVVIFDCTPKGTFKKTKQVMKACEYISKLTKKILWDDTVVSVTVNGETIYDSRI